MTTPKVTTKYNKFSDRVYVHDESGKEVPGVSAIKSMYPSPGLSFWFKKATAEYCVDHVDAVKQLAESDKQGAVDLVANATTRYSKKAANRGTEVHSMIEQLMRDHMAGRKSSFRATSDDLAYLRNFNRFFTEFDVKPVMVETTVWSQEHDYAGTFDLLCEMKGYDGLYIVDYKSGASGVYQDHGIQQTAYVYADSYIDEDGNFQKMPAIAGAFCLWVRPNGWALYPVRTDKIMWETFLHLRALYDYKIRTADTVVGKPVNTDPLKKVWKGNK